MRITPKMLQIKLSDIKVQTNNNNVKLGTHVKAKILALQDGALFLELESGETLKAMVQSPERFSTGQQLEFEVTGQNEGLMELEVVKESVEPVQIKHQLQQINMPVTEENVKAMETLQKFNLPISKAEITKMTETFKLVQVISDNIDKLPVEEKTPEKVIENMAKVLDLPSKDLIENQPLKKIVVELLKHSENQITSEGKEENIKSNNEEPVAKLIFGIIKESMEKTLPIKETMDKIGTLMKLDKPITLKSFSILQKLESLESNFEKQVTDILHKNEPLPPKLLSLLKGFKLENFRNDNEVKDYFDELTTLLTQSKESSSRVRGEINQLLETISFLKQDQEDVTWIQMPLQMNQETQNLDIMIRSGEKGNKVLKKDNAKILISLNTNTLDTVQAFIHLKPNEANVDFRVANDDIKYLFENAMGKLEGLLEDEFSSVKLTVSAKSKLSFVDFIEEVSANHINIKV
jgi:hypothetical protein